MAMDHDQNVLQNMDDVGTPAFFLRSRLRCDLSSVLLLTCSTPEDTPAYPPGTIDSTMHAITAGGIVAMVRVIRRNCWSGGTTIFLLTRRMADCIKNNNKAKNIFYNARVKPTGRCS